MIRLVNVHKSFEGVTALDGLDLYLDSGTLLGVMGPGGSGKSTLCKIISGLVKPDFGVVFLAGTDMVQSDYETIKKCRARIGMQFQNDALFEHMSVISNVEYPLKRLADLSPSDSRARAMEQLAMVGLAGFEDRIPSRLSGGQRRRVAIARACVASPDVLLCDDPTAGLDPVTSRKILDMIVGIHYQARNTVIIVSSDVLGLLSVADRAALVWEGKIIADDSPKNIWANERPRVRRFLDDARLPDGGSK